MKVYKARGGIAVRDGDYCFLGEVISGEINIISSHRHVFKRAMELDSIRMPSRYVPPISFTLRCVKMFLESLPKGDYYFYGEDCGRRLRVYTKALERCGYKPESDGFYCRFSI